MIDFYTQRAESAVSSVLLSRPWVTLLRARGWVFDLPQQSEVIRRNGNIFSHPLRSSCEA